MSRRRPKLLILVAPATALALAFACPTPSRAAVVERFETDPLLPGNANAFAGEGDVDAHFAYLPEEPPHFRGDRPGALRVLYDTTLPAGRISAPLGQVLSLDDDFDLGAILTIRSEGYDASPDGFDQIAFGLWNSRTTGLARTAFPSDSFDLLEFDYFANVTPFGGPFLSPSVFGGNVADNAFFNFSFASSQVALPLDVPLLCRLHYGAGPRALTVTVSRIVRGVSLEPIPGAAVTVDLFGIRPTFLLDSLGVAAYTEGFPSLHAQVDYDLLYQGALPLPFAAPGRRVRSATAPPATPGAGSGRGVRPGTRIPSQN